MANESNSTAALSLAVDTDKAVLDTRALILELEKLKAISASLGANTNVNSAATQSLRVARAEAEALTRDMGTTSSRAGKSAGEKFSASFSQTIGDGVRVTFRKAGTDALALATEVANVQAITQEKIRAEYRRTSAEQSTLEKRDVEGWRSRAAAAAAAASEILAVQRRNQAQIEDLDERAHAQRVAAYQAEVALARRTQAQIEAIDEAAYASRMARATAEAAARASINDRLMGKGGIGNRLLTGTSSSDLAELQLLGNAYAQLEAQNKKLAPAAKASGDAMRANNGVMADAHAAARGLSGSLGQLWVTYGNIAPLVAFAALGAGMRATFEVGKELEYQLKFVQVLAGGAAVDTEKFFEIVGNSVSRSTDAAKGLRMLTQSGLESAQAMSVLPDVLNLATIGETSVKEAAEAATGAMHAFNLEVSDMGRIGDVYAKAAAMSNASVQSIMESMKQASTISDFYHISLEETAASLAVMAKANITGSAAGTAFRNAMKELYTPTEKAKSAMDAVGLSVYDAEGKMKDYSVVLENVRAQTSQMSEQSRLTFLNDVFGERGAKAINALLSNYTMYNDMLKELQTSQGFVNKGVLELQDTVEGASIRMKNALDTSLAKAFTESNSAIRSTLDSLAQGFSSPAFQESLITLAKLTAVFTQALVENSGTIITMLEIYLGARGLTYLANTWDGVNKSVRAYTAAQAAATAAAEADTLARAAGNAVLNTHTTATDAAAKSAGTLTTGLAAASRVLGLVGVAVSAAVVAYQMYTLWQDIAAKSSNKLAEESDTVVQALDRENERLAENIRLLKEKTGAVAVQAKENAGTVFAANLAAEQAAQTKLNKIIAEGGAYTREAFAAEKELANARATRIAIGEGSARQQNQEAEVKNLNERVAIQSELNRLTEIASSGTDKAKVFLPDLKAVAISLKSGTADFAGIRKQLVETAKQINGAQDNSYKGIVKPDRAAASEARRQDEAELDNIKKRWDAINAEETRGFNNYKALVDQRSGSGALTKDAAAVMLEQAQESLNAKLGLNNKLESLDLDHYEKSNTDMKESSRMRLNTYRETLDSQLQLRRDNAAQDLALAKQAAENQILLDNRNLERARQKAEEQERLNQEKKTRDFDRRNSTDFTSMAGQDAYESSFQRNAAAVQKYADEVELSKQVVADMQATEGISTEALNVKSEALKRAEERLRAMKEVQTQTAESARSLAEAQQLVSSTYEEGASNAIKNYLRSVGTAADQSERLFSASFNSMESNLQKFVKTGIFDFRSFASAVVDELIKIQIQSAMTKVLGSTSGGSGLLGMLTQGLTAMLGGGGVAVGGSSVAPSAGVGMFLSAKGNAFGGGGAEMFANGGAFTNGIYSQPTPFMFAKGGGFALGGMGEAGSEAVMPLSRGSNGKLGVDASGMSGGGGNTYQINITVEGGKDPEETGDIVSAKTLAAIQAIADQRIGNATRVGGILNKVGS